MRRYSSFWLAYVAGLISLSPLWADRDAPAQPDPFDDEEMASWLRRSDAEHQAILASYVHQVVPRRVAA